MLVEEVAQAILNDPEFVKDIKESLDKILKDGKVDMTDAPEIILLVTLGYNKAKNFAVPYEQLGDLLTTLANNIIEKYDLIPDGLKPEFDKILQSSITLILLSPNVQSSCISCLPWLAKK